ncbi:MAG: DNA ligase D [Gammaproteobacteria bacterium]|nr:DNA ligase D [Gammaproteobacteria bacterium]
MPASENEKLARYRAKRSAGATPEPFGGAAAGGGQLFVVQHHAARQLHYDFRIELDGVLRSWAVPKGPSPNPADKRLAVQVEDHPLEYADFEGHIPAGNYGAGAVILWDRGNWRALNDPHEGMQKGKLLFELNGYKLRGKWTLVKTRRAAKDWLFIKEHDAFASEAGTEYYPADSVWCGLTVEQLKSHYDAQRALEPRLKRSKAVRRRLSAARAKPMLARQGEPFSHKDWLYEIKYDGYRLIAELNDGDVRLYSRNGNDLTNTFPEVAIACSRLPYAHLLIDGEVVIHDARGLPSFSLLQKRGSLTRKADVRRTAIQLPAVFYAFDLLGCGDYDLRNLTLEKRKSLLRRILPSTGPVRFSDHIDEQGETLYAHVRELGLEGVLAKRKDSAYHGGRSNDWIKVAPRRTDDFVIVGYTAPQRSQPVFGALLLAQYAGTKLVYTGRVGSGFKHSDLHDIGALVAQLANAPAPDGAPEEQGLTWIAPQLVCEIEFKERTPEGMLRQPVFVRVRDDKPPADCLLHSDAPQDVALEQPLTRVSHEFQLTNLDKIFWPAEKYTKGDLINYYGDIADWLLPYLRDRPLVMTRFPDGIEGKSFFQKDAPGFVPDWVRTETMWSEEGAREIRYFIADDVDTLRYIINLGCIPLHVWGSRLANLERPDWSILDLDPKGAPFTQVVKIARAIRRLCDDIGLPSYVKTSGSTGLHILLPLGGEYTFEQSRSLAQLMAYVIATRLPAIATITRAVGRREGKVYIDYLQNGHGRLLVSAFSARPLAGAPVSMPLKWSEVNSKLDIARYTIKNAVARMRRLGGDPLRGAIEDKPDIAYVLEQLALQVGTERKQ